MRRRDRRRTWGLWGDFVPIADRDMRLEVDERTLADGTIRAAVDPDEVRAAARTLLAKGAQALAIIFINAYANAGERARARSPLRARSGRTSIVTASHEVLPEIREFERSSTTALNAYLQPVVASYLAKLEAALGAGKFRRQLPHRAVERRHHVDRDRAAAAGAHRAVRAGRRRRRGARRIAKAAGFDNVITCDLGGTSFDVSVIAGGKASLAAQTTIDFGLVIRTPMIEITTIGAGGGSIASVDRGGLAAGRAGKRRLGARARSATARATTRPTLTDAQVVLGRINAERPIGGELATLDVEAARTRDRRPCRRAARPRRRWRPPRRSCASPNARMAGAIRLVSIERGHDPATFVADAVRRRRRAACRRADPRDRAEARAGAALSRHHVGARLRHRRHAPRPGADAQPDARRPRRSRRSTARMASAGQRGERGGRGGRAARSSASTSCIELDMHYLGQTHTVAVPLPVAAAGRQRSRVAAEMVRSAFERSLPASFSRLLPGIPVRIVSLRTAAIGRRPHSISRALAPDAGGFASRPRGAARARCGSTAAGSDTAIWSRLATCRRTRRSQGRPSSSSRTPRR